MRTSTVEYRGRQFDAKDSVLEFWLRLIVDQIDQLPEKPEWLVNVREDWYLQATEDFAFGVDPNLDEVLTDRPRRELMLELARRALDRLESLGDPIPAARLNALLARTPEKAFQGDVRAELFLVSAQAFVRLLEDETPAS